MRMGIVVVFLAVWVYLAYEAYSRGDSKRAVTYLAIGVAFAAWRVMRYSRA